MSCSSFHVNLAIGVNQNFRFVTLATVHSTSKTPSLERRPDLLAMGLRKLPSISARGATRGFPDHRPDRDRATGCSQTIQERSKLDAVNSSDWHWAWPTARTRG